MIILSALGKSFGAQVLFEDVSLQLNPGCRYGLVGANGSGKTTFLKILAGFEPETTGSVSIPKQLRLGVLRQDQFLVDEARILDVAMSGDQEVYAAIREQEELSRAQHPDPDRMVALEEVIAHHDGYTLESRSREMLIGLGLPPMALEQPMSTLSGGFKLRVLLAQVLVGRPHVLLLDEPTNHLDILSIRWLERFLQGYQGCAVIISHDRGFLDGVATRILDVDYQTITDYPGNYTSFIDQKAATRARKEAENARIERAIAEKKAFVERFRAKATKARQAQSRVKQLEKMEIEELPRTSRVAPRFRFEQTRPSGRDVLELEGLSKSYGEKLVLHDVNFTVRRGERLALIGANGVGKSTLLRILAGRLEPSAGRFTWGHAVAHGYFAQDHRELLGNSQLTPLQYVWEACPAESTNYVRGQLGRMLFSGEDVDKPAQALSGGESARVIFARLAVEKPNVLILDEPTNHLDLETIDALLAALRGYEGTLLFVSHDRYFVRELATRVIEIRADGLHDVSGTYDDYVAQRGDDHLDRELVVLKAKKAKGAPEPAQLREERKKRQNRLKSLPRRRDEILARIETLEKEKDLLAAKYSEPGFFERTTLREQQELEASRGELERLISTLMGEWEVLEQEIEQLSVEAEG